MANKFSFKILSRDGKSFEDEIDELYADVPGYGIIGFLKGALPTIAYLDVGYIYFYKDKKKEYISLSGGILDVEFDKTVVLADTFEFRNEIDKDRQINKINEVKEKLSNLEKDSQKYKEIEFSLKKAMNRLELIDRR